MIKLSLKKKEICKRSLKYIIIALVVALSALYIPENKLSHCEVLMIAITAACTFSIIDMYAPTVLNNIKN